MIISARRGTNKRDRPNPLYNERHSLIPGTLLRICAKCKFNSGGRGSTIRGDRTKSPFAKTLFSPPSAEPPYSLTPSYEYSYVSWSALVMVLFAQYQYCTGIYTHYYLLSTVTTTRTSKECTVLHQLWFAHCRIITVGFSARSARRTWGAGFMYSAWSLACLPYGTRVRHSYLLLQLVCRTCSG
ncbi:hypothetical protein HOY82DRAFT_318461 [Tuber indicum]|nr:hypothetical protein HOY82DRAFT_318461 [Tuber indicum]